VNGLRRSRNGKGQSADKESEEADDFSLHCVPRLKKVGVRSVNA
jgi:hypothetical protein